ncbi:MAG: ROK family protein [Bacteroidales bacterium]|nr:ROK family protein [Bacteroidales bacterium]
METKQTYTVGIDIGGTNTDFGFVDSQGKIVQRGRLKMADYNEVEPYVKALSERLLQMADGLRGGIDAIGIGAPNGNFYTSCIEHAPNLKFKGIVPLKDMIQQYIPVPVTLSNDANAAAYGELVYGGAKGMKDMTMFTLGTGVGSGVIVDGRLVHGFTGCAGELGHAVLIPEGRLCSCGRRGCLEEYASARGICQTFEELRAQNPAYQGVLAEVPFAELDPKRIADAAHAGDALALQTYERTAYLLGIACANAVAFSSPEAIFLMGGPVQAGSILFEPLKRSFEAHLYVSFKGRTQIRLSEMNANDVAILGAAALTKMPR